MSAFLCSPELIAVLATRLASYTKRYGDAGEIATTLATENVRSIQARYPDQRGEDFTAFVADCAHPARLRAAEWGVITIPPERIYGLAACYDYQACETSDWQSTTAFNCITTLRDYEVEKLFAKYNLIPGWEFTEIEIGKLTHETQ